VTAVHEVPLPPGIGIEPSDPDGAQLVGTADDLLALSYLIKVRLGGPHPLPVLLDSSLVVAAEREARGWKRRFDDLLAAVTSGQITTVAALEARPDPEPSPPATSPFEAGTGPCPMKGCTETGAHVHPGWMVARAAGRLTPELASHWGAQQWIEFLRAHDLTQHQGVAELRSWAENHWGHEPPSSLRSVKDRPDLARVLLDLADRTATAQAEAVSPW